MYVKLFGSILDSSIWSTEPMTRLLWITMLAMADEYGTVYASVDGLAHRARISEDECTAALAVLEGPDKHSRDGTTGERIKRLTGGWELLNYQHYREMRTREQVAASVRQKRSRAKNRDTSQPSVTGHDVTTDAEAEGRTRKKERKEKATPSAGAATWLTPYLARWEQEYGAGSAATLAGRLAKSLRPLHEAHGEALVLDKLGVYLGETEARFANPQSFAQRFAQWGNHKALGKVERDRETIKQWMTNGQPEGDRDDARAVRRTLPATRSDPTDG